MNAHVAPTTTDCGHHETVYEHLCRIENLSRAAELLAHHYTPLDHAAAPPIRYLLSLVNEEIDKLSTRVSD